MRLLSIEVPQGNEEPKVTYRSRERVDRILRHQEADRVPYCTGGTPKPFLDIVETMDLEEDARTCYLEGDFKYIHFNFTVDREVFREYVPGLPAEASLSEWGIGELKLQTADGYGAGNKTFHPLAKVNTVADLERYPWPDYTDERAHGDLEERIAAVKAQGYTAIGQMSQTILETSYCMRGLEQLFLDFYERPEYVEALFEKIAERRRFQARRYMEAGADVLRIGDDIATQHGLIIGPALYRERIQPFHRSVIEAARKLRPDIPVLYHSDGKLTGLLPDLIDAGVTGIHPVQAECIELAGVKREYGKDLFFWGCLPTQSIFAHGSGDEVKKYLRYLMKEGSPGGGLVVEFYNTLVTPKLLENVRAFFEEFYNLGWYPGKRKGRG